MRNNKGFSLVELIIVVAIMAVMGGFIFYSFGLLTGQDARKCANNISTVLDKEKNYALTKSAEADCYVEIIRTADGYEAKYYVPQKALGSAVNCAESQQIGKTSVTVSCYKEDGSGNAVLAGTVESGKALRITYNRSSGAIKDVSIRNGDDGTGSVEADSINRIKITKGRTYEIELFTATGKHTLERTN